MRQGFVLARLRHTGRGCSWPRVQVRTELACYLEARQQVLEGADRIDHVSVAVEDASPSVLPAISTMAITLLR